MSKDKMNKVTLKDLIARAEQSKADKKELRQLYVTSLDGTITIIKPDRAMVLEAMDMGNEEDGDRYLVYNCVVDPNLKDKDLQNAYKTVSPLDIVDKIFDPGEVASISKEIVRLAGYIDSVKVVDDIKNV
jgi:hypothetical protein